VPGVVNGGHTLLQISRFEYQRWGFPAQLERNLVNVQPRLIKIHEQTEKEIAPHTFFRLLFAAASMIFLPVAVDPVKATYTKWYSVLGHLWPYGTRDRTEHGLFDIHLIDIRMGG